jgi:hypothetical protein
VLGVLAAAACVGLIAISQYKFQSVHRVEVRFAAASADAPQRLRERLEGQRGVLGVEFHGSPARGSLGIRIVQSRALLGRSVLADLVRECEAAGFVRPAIVNFDYRV